MSIETMKQALEALEILMRDYEVVHGAGDLEMQPAFYQAYVAADALRQAIEQAEKPEAQRHISYVCPNCHWSLDRQPDHLRDATKKVWVGLTEGEIGEEVLKRWPSQNTFMGGALWAEAKLKEKNNG